MPIPSPSTVLVRTQSDERLVDLARAGHERAFDAIVERYRSGSSGSGVSGSGTPTPEPLEPDTSGSGSSGSGKSGPG
jgi:hypothetical protein